MIAGIRVQRGDPIRRGQVLVERVTSSKRATVESARFRARMEGPIAAARNRIDYATKKLQRLTEVQKENFMSVQASDEADAEKRLAEAELKTALESRELAELDYKRAKEMLALRTVAAPFDGVVVDQLLNPGDLADAGSGRRPVLRVAQIDPLRVDVALPAALIGQIKVGIPASVAAAVGGASFPATVKSVDKVIDAASSTFIARLELPNAQGRVPAGARCMATIEGLAAPTRLRP